MPVSKSRVYQLAQDWKGFDAIKHLVVFGDSYSSVGYDSRSPHPSLANPLGVSFPGPFLWNEPDLPNWVGHLISTHRGSKAPLLVYDYAVGGHRLSGVNGQITNHFLPYVGKKPDWAPWTASDTLFVTWVGINDCAYANGGEYGSLLEEFFRLQQELYEAGARNFLFVDVPPIERSPAVPVHSAEAYSAKYLNWNAELSKQTEKFVQSHPDVSAFVFSSWQTFACILDDPDIYGFLPSSAHQYGGDVWYDHLHPTSAVHKIICDDFYQFVSSIPPHEETVAAEAKSEEPV